MRFQFSKFELFIAWFIEEVNNDVRITISNNFALK